MMANGSYFRFDEDNKLKYVYYHNHHCMISTSDESSNEFQSINLEIVHPNSSVANSHQSDVSYCSRYKLFNFRNLIMAIC